MASDYAIRLKATLDTSEVQREIQKLKSVQRGGSGRDDSRQGGGPGGGNNLGNLGSTLTKLKGSLDALRKSVDSLATVQRQNFQTARNPRTEAQMAMLMGGLGGTRGGIAYSPMNSAALWRNRKLARDRIRGQNGYVVKTKPPMEVENADEPIPEPISIYPDGSSSGGLSWGDLRAGTDASFTMARRGLARIRSGFGSNIRNIPGWLGHRLRGMGVWAVRQFGHPFRSDDDGGRGYFYRSPWD